MDKKQTKTTNTLKVERETYEKDGRTFYTYFIRGSIRGREVKVTVAPQDIGGYATLDIVFNDANAVDLVITPFEFKDEAGKSISGNSLTAQSFDDNGDVYECKVVPLRASDKALLKMLLSKLN